MRQFRYILLLVLAVAMASCHTQHKLTNNNNKPIKHKQQLIDRVVEAQPHFTTLQAQKAKITLNYGDRKLSASATINLYHDSAMVVSVQPLLGIELFRVEVDKKNIIVVDKLNRRYGRLEYESVYQVAGHRLEFGDIEALLTACAFVVGKDNKDLGEMKFKVVSDDTKSELKTSYNEIDYLFRITNLNMLIEQTVFALTTRNIEVDAAYQNHLIWDEKHTFPQTISMSLTSPKLKGTVNIGINQLTFDKMVDVAPCNLKKYQQTALINLIK